MESFHETIAVDYYCGVWPSILCWMCGAGLWGNSACSIVLQHRLPHEQEAPWLSRPPAPDPLLNTQDSRLIVGWIWTGRPTTMDASLPWQWASCSVFFKKFYFILDETADKREARHATQKAAVRPGWPSFICGWKRMGRKCIINQLQAASCPAGSPTYLASIPLAPGHSAKHILRLISRLIDLLICFGCQSRTELW